jgi:hypothetical protein
MSTFPVHYRPRPYQAELHQMWDKYRLGVAVLPRQSGKDLSMSMQTCKQLLLTPKTTAAYISLDNPMVRDILYDKTYYDPDLGQYVQALQDNVPTELVTWRDTWMEGRFTNKSRLKLQGYFQSGKDKNGVGTSFQYYAFTELSLFVREDPLPRLLPILSNEQEQKRLMVVATPRGKRRNPLWQLMQSFKGSPDYQCVIRTIDDLNEMMRKEGLPPVRSEAQLEQDRDAYRRRFGNDRMFNQEYYVDFEEMDAAAVYGEAYLKMESEQRIIDFNLNAGHPVFVAFDIGASGIQSDATAWLAFQWINGRMWIYDSGEGHGKALPEYVDVLREKHWFPQIAQMILPWDGDHHEKAVNTTPADMMRTKFPNVSVLAKSGKVWKIPGSKSGDFDIITDIQQARMQLYNTVMHKSNNDWLGECFENYKYEFNTKLQEWTAKPLHDKHSHLMDAYRYAVQATKELDFFGGNFFEQPGSTTGSVTYTDDWTGVWAKR